MVQPAMMLPGAVPCPKMRLLTLKNIQKEFQKNMYFRLICNKKMILWAWQFKKFISHFCHVYFPIAAGEIMVKLTINQSLQ